MNPMYFADLLILLQHFRRNKLYHRQPVRAGLKVLTDREKIAPCLFQIPEKIQDLFPALSQAPGALFIFVSSLIPPQ